jgi:hypothetical protein
MQTKDAFVPKPSKRKQRPRSERITYTHSHHFGTGAPVQQPQNVTTSCFGMSSSLNK